jgi:hypothetical protein
MPIVARCNGTLLVEEGDRLGVVEQGGGGIPVAIFVAALIAVIPGANAIYFLFVDWRIAAALMALSAAGIVAVILLARLLRSSRNAALPAPRFVFDRRSRTVFDRNGKEIAPFDRVRLERAWQVASSYRSLVMHHPDGSIVIARGTPFGDSVAAMEQALRAYGVG